MAAINQGKVLVGGLVAGLIFNVIDMITGFTIMKDDMQAMVDRLHLDPAMMTDPMKMMPWIAIDFMMGILAVWTYAAMRPRFGPGPLTAAKAGITLWLAVSLIILGFVSMGVFAMDMFVKQSLESLVSVVIGTMAGAAIYKEA
jgi:hypothetical protein